MSSAIQSQPRFPIETRLFINNEYVDALAAEPTIDLVNPVTGREVAKVQVAGEQDVDRAVETAQAAFPGTCLRSCSPLRCVSAAEQVVTDDWVETR